jgi:exosome complex component RRP4
MESTTLVKERDVVVPGTVLAEGLDYLPSKGTYRLGSSIVANRLGLVEFDGKVIKTVPLAGRYSPKKDDIVIGRVFDVLLSGWRVEINSPYESVLTLKDASDDFIQRGADLTRYFTIGDWVVCQVVQVTSQNLIDVSMRGQGLRKLVGGTVISVNAQKVPRIIGRKGSMLGMIKKATDCNSIVGQNGRIWLSGSPTGEQVAIQAIQLIEREAHTSGLTERVANFLQERTGRSVQPTEDSALGNADTGAESTSVIRSSASRDPSQLGSFRQGGFRKSGPRSSGDNGSQGGFRNTNSTSSGRDNPATNHTTSASEDEQ